MANLSSDDRVIVDAAFVKREIIAGLRTVLAPFRVLIGGAVSLWRGR